LIHAAGQKSPVDNQNLTGHVGRSVGSQEYRGASEFIDIPEPIEWRSRKAFAAAHAVLRSIRAGSRQAERYGFPDS
jgi:hypothetical protein